MKINRYSTLAVSIALCLSSTAYGGGFTVTVQSASSGGTASTNHAMAEDASAMFYNPALLSSMEGTQVNGGISLTSPDMTVTNTNSVLPSVGGGTTIQGENTAEPTDLAATPSLFYKRDLSDKMAFGLGINIPYGVSSEYDDNSFARYEATESALSALNINPALSWKVNEYLQVGAGLNVQFASATLAKATDATLLCGGIAEATATQLGSGALQAQTAAAALLANDPNSAQGLELAATAASLGAQATAIATNAADATIGCGAKLGASGFPGNFDSDGISSVEATGIAYGINLGAAYKPNSRTTISVGLRSATKYELEGDVDFNHSTVLQETLGEVFSAPTGAEIATGASVLSSAGYGDRDVTADLELPATASLAFATKMNPKLTLHGDVTWTDWSSVPEIRIVFPSTTDADLSDSVTALKWEDTVRVGAGMTYQLSEKTKLRAGIAYDPTPTPSSDNRTPRAPSSDNLWLSVGVGHSFSKKLSIDASLAYIHPEDASITYTTPGSLDYITRADVESDAISAALSVNYRFK